MFEPGSIIMVAEPKPGCYYLVTVRDRIGPIKGKGWLIRTVEGNYCIVTGVDQYIARCCFIIQPDLIQKMVAMATHPKQDYSL